MGGFEKRKWNKEDHIVKIHSNLKDIFKRKQKLNVKLVDIPDTCKFFHIISLISL